MLDEMILNEWMLFSLILLGIWLVVYLAKSRIRKEMLKISIFTMPFGLMEPLFVPAYWNPPSLFNLAATTGFDIESLIFCFAVGGIASVLYESIFQLKHKKLSKKEMMGRRHRFHKLALISPALVFIPLYFLMGINPIYTASIAMFVGGISTIWCRPDLNKNVWAGGVLFTVLYFLFFLGVNIVFPHFISVWNLPALSGVILLGVPLEELIFAFTFGMMWSSAYEHWMWKRLGRI